MVKGLAAITTSPYGIFVTEKPLRRKLVIHLSKLDQIELPEGTRLSEKGVEAVTTVIKSWWLDDQQAVNATIDLIVDEWTKNKKTQEAVKPA